MYNDDLLQTSMNARNKMAAVLTSAPTQKAALPALAQTLS